MPLRSPPSRDGDPSSCRRDLSYVGREQPALHAVTLSITRGRSYGIVGISGAGKSTLVDVVAGLIEPPAGRVALDRTVLDQKLRSGMALAHPMSAVAVILDATIEENILFGTSPGSTHAESSRRIDAANLSSMIASFPRASDPRRDRGVRLSGGQRQRLALARHSTGRRLRHPGRATSALTL